jgi:hypothetical protein
LLLLKPTHVEATLGMVTTLTCTVELGDDSLAMSGEKDYPTIRWRHNGTALNFRVREPDHWIKPLGNV